MDPRITLVTLGVADLAKSRRFYVDGLGWRPALEAPGVVFIQMGGMAFGLWDCAEMAQETGAAPGRPAVGGMTLAHNVRTKPEVDATLHTAVRAGARLVKPAEDKVWGGRSGYFADPDGHLWEIAWNPGWPLDGDGRVTVRA